MAREKYTRAGFGHRVLRLDHSTAGVRGSLFCRRCPSRHRPMDDRPCRHRALRRSTREDWRPGCPGGWRWSDFNVPRRWVIPVWRQRCPRESWHIACCLHEIMVSMKLQYSCKTVRCWLPHGCDDQRGSFVKLRLLSNQRRNRHICGWVKMKQYRRQAADQWRRYTGKHQIIWPCSKSYAMAVALAQVNVYWLLSWWNLSPVPSWKLKLRIFEICLTSLPVA